MVCRNFNDAVLPVLRICKALGMAPFQISNNNYKISWPGMVHSLVLIVAYLCGFGYMIYINIHEEKISELLYNTITTLQNLSGLGIVQVVWITSLMNQKKYIAVLDKMNEIDKSFRCLGVWTYYKTIKKTSIKVIIGKCAVMTVYFLLEMYYKKWRLTPKHLIMPIMHSIPLLVYAVLSLQVFIYLKMIKERFVILNQHLKELQRSEMSVNVIEVKSYKLTSPLDTKLSTLRIICPLHHELCKAINMFNDIYGVCLLITFGESFVSITTNMYYIVNKLKAFEIRFLSQILTMFGAFLINVLETIWVCWICHTTIEEVGLFNLIMLIYAIIISGRNVRNSFA